MLVSTSHWALIDLSYVFGGSVCLTALIGKMSLGEIQSHLLVGLWSGGEAPVPPLCPGAALLMGMSHM